MSTRTARLVVAITLAVALASPVAARPAGEETARDPRTVRSLVERWLGPLAALFADDSSAVKPLSAAGSDEQDAGPHTDRDGAAGPQTDPNGAGPETDPDGDAGPQTDPDG